MMDKVVRALDIRRRIGRKEWIAPYEFGPDGWVFDRVDRGGRIIVSAAPIEREGVEETWIHASISHPEELPTYEELTKLHAAVWPGGYSYQMFVPPSEHVNIHPFALHLWGRADGANILPHFGITGSI